jgi:hypothetical protein
MLRATNVGRELASFTCGLTPADVVLTMFREIALVTFTAGMLGTSAATLYNAGAPVRDAQPAPAIERPAAPAPVESAKPLKQKRNVVALDIR